MPGGYLELVAIIGLYTGLVLWPPRRPRALATAVYFVSHTRPSAPRPHQLPRRSAPPRS
jgi:hypothetical protein